MLIAYWNKFVALVVLALALHMLDRVSYGLAIIGASS